MKNGISTVLSSLFPTLCNRMRKWKFAETWTLQVRGSSKKWKEKMTRFTQMESKKGHGFRLLNSSRMRILKKVQTNTTLLTSTWSGPEETRITLFGKEDPSESLTLEILKFTWASTFMPHRWGLIKTSYSLWTDTLKFVMNTLWADYTSLKYLMRRYVSALFFKLRRT